MSDQQQATTSVASDTVASQLPTSTIATVVTQTQAPPIQAVVQQQPQQQHVQQIQPQPSVAVVQQQQVQPQPDQTQQQQQQQQQQIQQVQQQQISMQQPQHVQPQQHVQAQQVQAQHIQQAQQQLQQLGNQQNQMNTSSSLGLTLQTQQALRSPLQQVQVIHQPVGSQAYLQQLYNQQQQFMLQNAAVQAAMQARGLSPQLNLATLPQGRPMDQKNTAMVLPATNNMAQATCTATPWGINPSDIWTTPTPQAIQQHQAQTQLVTAASSSTPGTSTSAAAATASGKTLQTIAGKPIAAAMSTATQMIAGKPVMHQRPGVPQQLVIGQIGVIPNQNAASHQALMSQMGQYANMQGKSQTVTVAAQPQLINSPTQIRFAGPQLLTNTGQIISGQSMLTNPAVLNHLQAMALQQNIPIAHQVIGSQSQGILTNQAPLYIRAAMPMQQAQQFTAASVTGFGNVSTTTTTISSTNCTPTSPIKAKANADQTPPSTTNTPTTMQGPKPVKQNSSSQTVRNMMNMMARANAAQNGSNNNNGVTSSVSTQSVTPNIPTGAVRASGGLPRQVSRVKGKTQSKPSSPVPPNTAQKSSVSPKPALTNETNAIVNNGTKTPLDTEKMSCKSEKGSDGEKKDKVLNSQIADINDEPPQLEKQKAIVKPHVLTHIIDGYVIQEANEPFPVQRSSLLTDPIPPKIPRIDKESGEEIMKDEKGDTTDENVQDSRKCEFCGKVGLAVKFKRSKRFCSLACTKRYNVGFSKRLGLFQPKGNTAAVPPKMKKKRSIMKRRQWRRGQGPVGRLALNMMQQKQQSLNISPEKSLPSSSSPSQFLMPSHSLPHEETTDSSSQSCQDDTATSSPATPLQQDFEMIDAEPSKPPAKWTVEEVYEFIKALPGCANHAQEFKAQEIDGQALLLLKEDHLMSAMSMKLGPALKICARINSLKDEIC